MVGSVKIGINGMPFKSVCVKVEELMACRICNFVSLDHEALQIAYILITFTFYCHIIKLLVLL